VVDERSEIAACYNGVPQNYLGVRTDVLDGCPKEKGIELMLRSMSPEVIAVDELGGQREMELIEKSIYCGCTILATVHGEGRETWFSNKEEEHRKNLLTGRFERYIFLKPGMAGCIETVCDCTGREVPAEW
jgi:stage III sporulation protein AA